MDGEEEEEEKEKEVAIKYQVKSWLILLNNYVWNLSGFM